MILENPRLTNAGIQLDRSLDALELAINVRTGIQQQIDRSWRRIDRMMKALSRRWDWAEHERFRKQYGKHAQLHKQLLKAQSACVDADAGFQDSRKAYDAARASIAGQVTGMAAELALLQRAQSGLNRTFTHVVGQVQAGAMPPDTAREYRVAEGAYGYIPMDVTDFLSLLARLDEVLVEDADYASPGERYRPVSLIEVGCGPGRNLVIARESKLVNWGEIAGFEIDPDQVELGRRAFGLTRELQVADAMRFDYGSYDVVYSFRPFSDLGLLSALEAHIAGSMRQNAYLLAPMSHDLGLYRELVPVCGVRDLWKKVGA